MILHDPRLSQPFQTTMSADLLVMETVAIILNALVSIRLFRFIWALGRRMRVARGMIWLCATLSLHTAARIVQFGAIWLGGNNEGLVSKLPLSVGFVILLWMPVYVFDTFGAAAFKREPAPVFFQVTRRVALMAALIFSATFLIFKFRNMSEGQILLLVAALIVNSLMTGYVLLRARHHDPALSNYGIGVLGISGSLSVFVCFSVLHPHTHALASHLLLLRSAVNAGTVLVVLSALFVFSSSRFADALLKDILRIYWLGFMLLVAWFGENGLAVHPAGSGLLSSALQKLVSAAFLLACVAVYLKGQQALEYFVSSWMFRKPDYATLLQSIQKRMEESEDISGWFAAVLQTLSGETGFATARILSIEELGDDAHKLKVAGQEEFFPSPQDPCRLVCSPPAEVLLPVRDHGEVRFALAVASDLFKGDGLGNAQVSGGNGIHVGLVNIRKRLYVHYGTAAGITLTDRTDGGVRATIHLPQSAMTEAHL